MTSLVSAGSNLYSEKNIVCSTIDVVACSEGSCLEVQARDFDLPQFLFVDLERKLIRATGENAQKETSLIGNFRFSEGQIVLQGVEKGKGWSIVINPGDGHMSATVAGRDVELTQPATHSRLPT